ncbi:protein associated with UVRAG as autophagy enhancer isoform X1 [Amphiprion ocellaris]|uniref:Rubicon Homology domain-containing protein n=2 Tax=Amphiprion ocellaris TaxID=80972 RepID=A0A3Q1CCZ2_AMPOC|nr:protein associated with UVRAG as autophagy enhancer isoform X1 [Amphiprion ocellaris]
MMGSYGGMSSSLYRSRYVSWCLDDGESTTASGKIQKTTKTDDMSESADSASVPLLLLSPPETDRHEAKAAFSHQPKRNHQKTFVSSQSDRQSSSSFHNNDKTTDGHCNEVRKGNLTHRDIESQSKEEPQQKENENFHLPRSSPVISRRRRSITWTGGGTDNPTRSDSPSPASLDCSLEDLESKPSSCLHSVSVQADEKQRCTSVSSNLNYHLMDNYLPDCGQRGLEEEQGRSQSPGLSTSTHNNKERRCSEIPDFSTDIFKTSCDLEKENAHFIVVDMVLEVLEGAKWSLNFNRRTSNMDKHCDICTQTHKNSTQETTTRRQIGKIYRRTRNYSVWDAERDNNKRPCSDEDAKTTKQPQEETGSEEMEYPGKTLSILSTDSGFEDFGVDATLMHRDSVINAEFLAQQLVVEFRRSWIPSNEPQRGRQSLRSSLQELPGNGGVAVSSGSLTEEIRLRTRMRGSLNWAPPRFQIIFTVQPTHRRSEVVALQHFLCAGCGTEVEPRYIKKLRYCDYLGRYFCDCCHSGSEAVIPARVLSCWDFGRYSVSDFSKQLLDSVWNQPLFDLNCVGKTLYSRVKELDKFRELQEQLLCIKKLLKSCRLSGSALSEFEQLPVHLVEQLHLFSMDDLLRVKKGQLVVQARNLLHSAIDHVENCQLCLARGFICEFCREKDVIFPFQSDICKRCTVCKACFHKHCFAEKKCPKCARIQSRKKSPGGSMKCDM